MGGTIGVQNNLPLSSSFDAICLFTKLLNEQKEQDEGLDGNGNVLRANHYLNRSLAYLNAGQPFLALKDARSAIEFQPGMFESYIAASRASLKLNLFSISREFFYKASACAPLDAQLQLDDLCLRLNEAEENSGAILSADEASRKMNRSNAPLSVGWTFSWGLGAAGQLGLGDRISDKASPSMIEGLRGKHVVEVGAGAMHTIALTATKEVYAWGDNSHKQLGFDRGGGGSATPVLIPRLLGVAVYAISCGAGHTIVLAQGRKYYAWGMGRQGQLGLGLAAMEAGGAHEPTLISELARTTVTAVAAGIAHSFFLTDEGSLVACGSNAFGQLGMGEGEGVGPAAFVSLPTPVLPICGAERISHISCGGAHTLVVDDAGFMFASGSNSCGQVSNLIKYLSSPFSKLFASPSGFQLGLGNLLDALNFTRIGVDIGNNINDDFFSYHRLLIRLPFEYV